MMVLIWTDQGGLLQLDDTKLPSKGGTCASGLFQHSVNELRVRLKKLVRKSV